MGPLARPHRQAVAVWHRTGAPGERARCNTAERPHTGPDSARRCYERRHSDRGCAGTDGGPTAVPSSPAASVSKQPPVVIETDVMRATIDPEGAVLSRVELLKEKVAPDWTASGLLRLVTGKTVGQQRAGGPARRQSTAGLCRADRRRRWRCVDAQSSIAFTVVDGPRSLAQDKDAVDVTLVSESGGVKVAKTYTFHRGRYDVTVKHEVTNVGDAPVTPSLYQQILRDGNKPEGESALYYTYTGPAVFTEQDKFKKIDARRSPISF